MLASLWVVYGEISISTLAIIRSTLRGKRYYQKQLCCHYSKWRGEVQFIESDDDTLVMKDLLNIVSMENTAF